MIGIGYDIHRLAAHESLIIGGVKIESERGTIAHSDGDVLLHALCDALIGAAALGDIGEHFPDSDEQYRNIASSILLEKVIDLITQKKLKIINIDATIILEKPKISNYKNQMRLNIASICQVNFDNVNIKATTNESVGFIGRGEGIAALCVCELSYYE